jgi:glycosyltransferase involved in cell wall biosynthesis
MKFKRVYIVEPVGGHGGMDLYDYGQCAGLAHHGYAVSLCTCDQTLEKDLHLVRTRSFFGKVWSGNKLERLVRFYHGYLKSFKAAQKDHATVVHFHFFQIGWLNWGVLQLARFYRFKKVVTLHDVDPFVHATSPAMHRRTVKRADAVVVHNDFSRKELVEKGVPAEKIRVIPHGNYCDFIEALPARKKDGTLQLLFFGQIKTVKGLDVLLEGFAKALKHGAKIHLTIAGRPWHADWQDFETLIEKHALQPYLTLRLDYIPNDEVSALFAASDLVVLPYRRIYQSGVLLLAMSYGRPCLCSDLEPFTAVIEEGKNGLLFPDGSAEGLAQQLLALSENMEVLDALRTGALHTVRQAYDWKVIGGQLIELYEYLSAKDPANHD